jgi:hypothetical protein
VTNADADNFDKSGGVRLISYHAVLTRRIEDYIAAYAIPSLQTTNFHLQTEKDALRAKVHENFKGCAMLGERGLILERGKWRLESPEHLK